MIIIKLQGGLGNQLFQYGFVRALSLEYKREFAIDISWYKDKKKKYHPNHSITNFNIIEKRPSAIFLKYITLISRHNRLLLKPLNKISKFHMFWKLLPNYINENTFNILDIPQNNILYFDGYWQNIKYFQKFESIIRKEFTLKHKLIGENEKYLNKIVSSNSISIHIRRGVYISDPHLFNLYPHCSLTYYYNVISYIVKKIQHPIFFVFSNEIEWAKKYVKIDYPTVFIENSGPDYEHLFLMSQCKHNIIADSTFSWWGAWLNNNPSKIIIAPKKWYNDSKQNRIYMHNIIPQSWVTIKN